MFFSKVFLILNLFPGAIFTLALPKGFVEEELIRVNAITGAFASNPRQNGKPMLLLAAKEGQVLVFEDPDKSETYQKIADFSELICTNGERGVLTIRPHPDFGVKNFYIFIYYTRYRDGCHENENKGPKNRLSRFEMDEDTLEIDLDSEKMLLETSPLAKRVHNGGSVEFGKDGKIWVSTGEGSSTSTNLNWAQNPSNLHGKILRINQDGSIPNDNPFVKDDNSESCHERGGSTDKNKVCSEIWATGMRNPFRMVMDPNTEDEKVVFHVGDVGAAVWEEISVGGTDYPKVNYGWFEKEGPCKRNQNDNCPVQEEYLDPFYYYEHREEVQGGAVVGSAFVPKGVWPEKYKYMFIDFVFKEIYNLIEDKGRECRKCVPPIPGYKNETFYQNKDDQNMIDMFFGPYKNTKALYIVGRGAGKTLKRIRYIGEGNDNRRPNAKLRIRDTDDTVFNVGQEIRFDGRSSSDPDGDFMEYFWDFGDGNSAKGSRTEHSYLKKGKYVITLTVKDERGLKDSDSVAIKIGTPPTATILSPKAGTRFYVEQELILFGNGEDSEGNREGITLSWEVRQHHAEHWHPFLAPGTEKNNFTLFPAPEPEDLLAATNSYLEILLTVTDTNGLSTTTSRKLLPEMIMVEVNSNPPGIKLLLDEFEVSTPANITSWQNHNILLDVDDHFPFIFESWQHGNRRTKRRQQSRVSLNNNIFIADFKKIQDKTINLIQTVRACSATEPCSQCEGHCQNEDECLGTLVCFKKGGRGKSVPGCIGVDNSNTDWCTLPNFITGSEPGTSLAPSHEQSNSNMSPSTLPLDQCEGHCQTNDDCIDDLICFKKTLRGTLVPGCDGIDNTSTNKCTSPTFITQSGNMPSIFFPSNSFTCPKRCTSNEDCCSNTCAILLTNKGFCVDFSFLSLIRGGV